ncbi:MAG: hypothetical protein KDD60_09930, partial [Bdellovibrionales bacterium]|nr:hypothetical protein [Bdellovibrionales bacterium]
MMISPLPLVTALNVALLSHNGLTRAEVDSLQEQLNAHSWERGRQDQTQLYTFAHVFQHVTLVGTLLDSLEARFDIPQDKLLQWRRDQGWLEASLDHSDLMRIQEAENSLNATEAAIAMGLPVLEDKLKEQELKQDLMELRQKLRGFRPEPQQRLSKLIDEIITFLKDK